jgi:hypothetical protein
MIHLITAMVRPMEIMIRLITTVVRLMEIMTQTLIRTMIRLMKIITQTLITVVTKVRNNETNFFCLFPFIDGFIFKAPDTLSNFTKVVVGILTIHILLFLCFINITAYFGCLYIIKHTELDKKYPKLKPIIKYYENSSIIFLISVYRVRFTFTIFCKYLV